MLKNIATRALVAAALGILTLTIAASGATAARHIPAPTGPDTSAPVLSHHQI